MHFKSAICFILVIFAVACFVTADEAIKEDEIPARVARSTPTFCWSCRNRCETQGKDAICEQITSTTSIKYVLELSVYSPRTWRIPQQLICATTWVYISGLYQLEVKSNLNVLATPIGGESGAIRERRADSFVCSTCPFICPYGGACYKGNCVCTPQLGPKPGRLPEPVNSALNETHQSPCIRCTPFSRASYVRRRSDEAFSPEYILPTVKLSDGSIMIWGCMSAQGVEEDHVCEGRMNGARYIGMLEEVLELSIVILIK
ncbi:hypothetical protein Trydic_g1853 [Trypoxylus dichotomus]